MKASIDAVDLVAVAARRIEEAVDAAGDMRQGEIGADEPADARDERRCRPR